ncbi:MAG: DUF362 domain-containing protein [Deltaproteobacteria bacterium]|nr:DUF362 domain-containing protein [Deltaproteobacteria bacterium]
MTRKNNPDLPLADALQRAADNAGKPRAYTRREITSKIAQTSVAALATLGLGTWLYDRETARAEPLIKMRDHRIARPAGAVDMAIARGPDAVENVRKALKAMGGLETFIKPGERVVVKPNVGWNRLPEQAANTNPELVAEVVRQCVTLGAKEVWVTDVSVNKVEQCFARSGIEAAAKAAGAKVVLPGSTGFRAVAVGGRVLQTAEVFWPFVDADKIINMPIVKHHGLTNATMSLKNWYGVIGGHRVRLHQEIDQSIADLAAMMKPTLTILDATRVLLANGPTGGSLDDVKRFDTVAVGVDEVALDAFGAGFLNRSPSELGFLARAVAAGIGTLDYKSLKRVEL